ncbi:nucleoporin 88-like [Anneissia japonica]|uniref:nucleoporin 88-like n=1 Tax=Anneissia japonica TaxID=1529436 RepID=UPI0014258BA9|nr:nucleoporin 88-like [Anneissia japonica]
MACYDENGSLEVLNSHPLFGILRENVKNSTNPDDSEELMAVKDGDLYVWDKEHLHLLTANLKVFVGPTDDDIATFRYQILLCTNAPIFEIESVTLNETSDYVMLHGQKGLAVLALPRRYGKNSEFEGGKRKINCRTMIIAERLFISNPSLKLLEAKWHPGSETGMHISILTSDNILRIYDIQAPQRPVQTHYLSEEPSPCLSSGSASFQAALGEVAISFDIGPPQKVITRRFGLRGHQKTLIYPIYILKGNGDVYLLPNSLKDKRYVDTRLQGPLAMYPPAEDNYGLDACALLCLPCKPHVLVVGTSSGHLHHCLVLTTEEDDDENVSVSSVDSGHLSTHVTECDSSLYVYETIELPMSPILSDDYDEESPHPVRLHQDNGNASRYYCTHNAGVHSVSLPWAKKLQQFCTEEGENDGGDLLLALREDQPCRVEHLVCTQPIPTSPPSPILGLAVVTDQLLGNHLLCLTSSYECLSLPVSLEEFEPPPDLLFEMPSGVVRSPLKRPDTQPFQNSIKSLLKRSSTNPILRSSTKAKLSPNECFMLLGQATKVLREEYILKQDLAREAIGRKVKILQEQKQQQQNDLKECDDLKETLGAKAEELADKYENTKEEQNRLVARIGSLLRQLQNRVPVLSDAEQSMKKELATMEEKLKHVSNSLEQVKLKHSYQKRSMKKDAKEPQTPVLNENQTRKLKGLIKEEGESIAGLVNKVKDISIHL